MSARMTTRLCEAMWEYVEKRRELDEALASYDGYSPSWALSAQFAARDRAEADVEEAFREAVKLAMKANP